MRWLPKMALLLSIALPLTAQIDPRRTTPADPGGKTGPAGTQNDGFGVCPAFTHYHIDWRDHELIEMSPEDRTKAMVFLDGKCHRDDNDAPINEKPDLKRSKIKPDPKDKWL